MASISEKIGFLLKNEIKVFPEHDGRKMAVCVWDKLHVLYRKTKTLGEFKHTTSTINEALENTVSHIYEKLKPRG